MSGANHYHPGSGPRRADRSTANFARPKAPRQTIPQKRSADTQDEATWSAEEDRFVLQQAKKKAELRVKEGRAKPVDWLAVTLRFVIPSQNRFEEKEPASDLDVVDPQGVFEGLDQSELEELEKEIDVYLTLEKDQANHEFWETVMTVCRYRRQNGLRAEMRGADNVLSDVDRLLKGKNMEDLRKLEKQVRTKLKSSDGIDIDYWEHLLRRLLSYKAEAKLAALSERIVDNQLKGLRQEQAEQARIVSQNLSEALGNSYPSTDLRNDPRLVKKLDPKSMLKVDQRDKKCEVLDESAFLGRVVRIQRTLMLNHIRSSSLQDEDRNLIQALGLLRPSKKPKYQPFQKPISTAVTETTKSTAEGSASSRNDDYSTATMALYEREAARGVGENEEIFTGEEEVPTTGKSQWANKYRPRKPRYFNRVQMGYEWNKYNQTHYDHENPPPKVVQGYKFNIFYPDLIDKNKSPTYKIEREHGRKRGQSFAPAGEDDTCLIRFVAGPPYEDIAFRIVDREWDYSAKRERGFRSSFDKVSRELPESLSSFHCQTGS